MEKFHDKEGAGLADEAAKKRECTEYVLQVIMGKKDLRVLEQVIQKDYKNLQGRSAILDCVAWDDEAVKYNVEVQQDNEGASPERARYHSGLMDMNTRMEGQAFEELPESYVIFITHSDVLGYGLPIYHLNRKIEEVLLERVRELKETQKDFLSGEVGLFYRR